VYCRARGVSFEDVEHTSTTVINHLKVIISSALHNQPSHPSAIHYNEILLWKVGGKDQAYSCTSLSEGTNFGNKLK